MNLSPDDQIIIHLEITNRYELHSKTEKRLVLTRKNPFVLGRSQKEADIILQDDSASRRHLEFRFIRHQIWIRDLQTKNGTFLNAKCIDNSAIKKGDLISIGDHHIFIRDIDFQVGKSEVTSQYLIAKKQESTRTNITVTNILMKMIG